MQASSVKDAAAAQEAMNALREELQQAQQEAEEATEMLKMKEIAWEEEKQRLLADKSAGTNGYKRLDLHHRRRT